MFSIEENHNKQLQVKIFGLKREKSKACEATRRVELTMNRTLHQAQTHEKERCLEVLTQSHTRFNCLMEISSCEAFRLGWEQALTDPLARIFSSPKEYDALNKIESGNYDLDFYVMKENLGVAFADEMEDETESQGGGSQVLGSEIPNRR